MAVHEVAATLVREPLDATPAAHEALRALRGDDRPFALIGAWAGGGAVLGSEPVRLVHADVPRASVLDCVDDVPAVPADVPGAVGGGWVGYLGFELRHAVEPGDVAPPRPV